MKASERRRKILDIFLEKGSLSCDEILEEMSGSDDAEILSDCDNLVFFRFIEHTKEDKDRLKLRSVTEEQMGNNIDRIERRLSKIVHEIPPWYRKLAILKILDESSADSEEVLHKLKSAVHAQWSPQMVNTSLRILESRSYVRRMEKELQKFRLTDKGKTVLAKSPLEKISELKKLGDEFADEFRAVTILDIVRKYSKIGRGISTGKIIAVLQGEYGRRGNQRRAVRKTLDKMVYCGLLNVSEDKRGPMGGSYTLGETALRLFEGPKVNLMDMNVHDSVIDFKETVTQFFAHHEMNAFPPDKKSRLNRVLDFLEQYEKNMEIAPKDEWVSHLMFLSTCLKGWKGTLWEEKETRCILACILSRLLPSRVSIQILEECPPPLPSRKQYIHQTGIAREYYFNVTKNYLRLGKYKEAVGSFDHLESLYWESPEFLILKGRIEMLRYDVRKPGEFKKVLKTFEDAEKMAKGEEKIFALFQKGLAYYQRGYFEEAKKTWEKCLESRLSDDQKLILNHNLANAYTLSGNLEGARALYEKTIEAAESLNMGKYRVNSLVSLTEVLIDLCLWDEAEKKLKETIQTCEEGHFLQAEALARANMGTLLTKRGKFDEALSYLEEAVKLAHSFCDPYEYGSILMELGDTFRKLQMTDEAMDVYERALQLIDRSDLNLMLAAEMKKADLYIDKGDYERSLELSKRVLEEAWLDDRRSRAEAYRIQGRVYLLKKEFYEARKHLEKSEEIFRSLELQYELVEVYELLEKCCRALKDEKENDYKMKREDLKQHISL